MRKKLFDWTPGDIAYWEKVQERGLWKFILRYGMAITGSLLFFVLGLITLFGWLRQMAGVPITQNGWMVLLVQLVSVALVSVMVGVANSLITWLVEQILYRKYKTRQGGS
jgi:hypothetical protein